ncbi:MAG: carbohydrate kinase [Oscillospiraceae bacterium]|jgi:sugar/nucleoside kinase (ribokinase family)
MFDLISFGELLIDFTPIGTSEKGNPIFERNAGGGPANLACCVAKLGGKAAFISKVGDDNFGKALREIVSENGVNVDNVILSKEYKTTLAFVHLDKSGDRSFSFYRKNGADTMIDFEEINLKEIDGCKYLFSSSVLMTEGTSRQTSFDLLEYARSKKKVIIFDPNLRLNLWGSESDAKECIKRALGYAGIVKLSEEELVFLLGEGDIKTNAKRLMDEYSISALLVTLGAKGCYAKVNGFEIMDIGFPDAKTIDTTAAGDSFTGGFIKKLIENGKPVSEYSYEDAAGAIHFANAVGALTTTKKGAISALPALDEVNNFMKKL